MKFYNIRCWNHFNRTDDGSNLVHNFGRTIPVLQGWLFRKTRIVINIAVISLHLENGYINEAKRKHTHTHTHTHTQLDNRHSCMEFSIASCQFKILFIQYTLLRISVYINIRSLTATNIAADCHVELASSALTHRTHLFCKKELTAIWAKLNYV